MKFKTYPIAIWFLDDNLVTSAQMLTDKALDKSIRGCIQALTTSRFYFIGIRNQKFYKFFFSKEKQQETLDRFFPLWPFQKPPLFSGYGNKIGKWTRKCKEHYNYIVSYLDILLQEYQFRHQKQHIGTKFFEWLTEDAPEIHIPEAHLKKIVVEWKSLSPRHRKKNIIDGYRSQYKAMIDNYGGPKIGEFTNRDIPEFLLPNEMHEDSNIGKFMQ